MGTIQPKSTNHCSCDFTRLTMNRACETCTSKHIEALLERVRDEIGNAAFATQTGMNELAVDALETAVAHIATVLPILQKNRP